MLEDFYPEHVIRRLAKREDDFWEDRHLEQGDWQGQGKGVELDPFWGHFQHLSFSSDDVIKYQNISNIKIYQLADLLHKDKLLDPGFNDILWQQRLLMSTEIILAHYRTNFRNNSSVFPSGLFNWHSWFLNICLENCVSILFLFCRVGYAAVDRSVLDIISDATGGDRHVFQASG